MPRYNPAVVEPKWQAFWEENRTFRCPDLPEGDKLYVLDMFPYPSGDGLHVGHPEGYTATDIVCRFSRMRGKSVLHPMGFDAFGLPAEEHAIKTNTPPRVQTEKNIETFRRQLKMLGFSYDWDRELATTDVDYFRWTQWIFLVLFDTWFDPERERGRPISELPIPGEIQAEGEEAVRLYRDEHRLAYRADALVNWCPALGTVLANEEVVDGKSERGGHPVERTPLRQWMLRITAYADRLEKDLDSLEWPESIKTLQRNWIGRSTGADVDFFLGDKSGFAGWVEDRRRQGLPRTPGDDVLRVYTTRPDTLYGATYMVIAPEHPFVDRLTTAAQSAAVRAYCRQAAAKSDLERAELTKEKTGVFTGSCAVNPVNGEAIPIWIADYVLISYGTGAIMAVPAHDTRDFEFAEQFQIPIIAVVDPGDEPDVDRQAVLAGTECFVGEGSAVNSAKYNGLSTPEFIHEITADLQADGLGQAAVNYKLRDWLFSRQRFWGEPFPILRELDGDGKETGQLLAVTPDELPVDLPHLDDYKPHGRPEPPLEKAPQDWLYVERNGRRYKRETNTMPQWAGSCWYYLRFIDPQNNQALVDPQKERAWMPIDLYVGGAEHAVLHLLYARFWHKVLFDRGYVSTAEPFIRLVNQGMILGEVELTGYQTAGGKRVSAADVTADESGDNVLKTTGEEVTPVHVEAEEVEKQGDVFVLTDDPSIRVDSRAFKMSKSRGNVINPDVIVREYGADSLRLYEMFMGPLEATKPWSMAGVNGVRGFLDRTWRMIVDDRSERLQLSEAVRTGEPTDDQTRMLHRTIMEVTQDTERMQFNTAIARMMEFVNYFTKQATRPKSALEQFVLLLSPFAPHIAEELWQVLGHNATLAYEAWPEYDEALTKEDTVEIPVQIRGKLRGKIRVPADISKADLETAARTDARIEQLLAGKQIVKTIVVPGRLVNFVVK
jgi:leucyl-tRNA synthetase